MFSGWLAGNSVWSLPSWPGVSCGRCSKAGSDLASLERMVGRPNAPPGGPCKWPRRAGTQDCPLSSLPLKGSAQVQLSQKPWGRWKRCPAAGGVRLGPEGLTTSAPWCAVKVPINRQARRSLGPAPGLAHEDPSVSRAPRSPALWVLVVRGAHSQPALFVRRVQRLLAPRDCNPVGLPVP